MLPINKDSHVIIDPHSDPSTLKPYLKPAIIGEFELETLAGSVLGIDPLDPNTWDSSNP